MLLVGKSIVIKDQKICSSQDGRDNWIADKSMKWSNDYSFTVILFYEKFLVQIHSRNIGHFRSALWACFNEELVCLRN